MADGSFFSHDNDKGQTANLVISPLTVFEWKPNGTRGCGLDTRPDWKDVFYYRWECHVQMPCVVLSQGPLDLAGKRAAVHGVDSPDGLEAGLGVGADEVLPAEARVDEGPD
eukprot:CAMPEP_0172595230 /NCGR_PEP_ID=MMETSP1068-20121228/14796_1 /TAXON_ID=35684 /ORGANISM="Pseudopedinella elastica, Strain CCMP716" /LENGTH=110 /DNA_ID=CAMNT_0013393665 /DNA_START=79 /DNA_END=412 /DNA_ORIENTATION=-